MERNALHPRALLALVAGALALAAGTACIDTSQIRGTAGGGGKAGTGGGGKSGIDAGHPNAGDAGLSNGSSCSDGSDCASGFCADGYCCNEACKEACYTCGPDNATTPLVAGTCAPVVAGTPDPHGGCVDKGASSCSTDGRCVGGGSSCETYPQGTVCRPSACGSGLWTPAAQCDGAGTCAQGSSSTACPSGACDSAMHSCGCQADVDCPSGGLCKNGSCLSSLGQPCAAGTDCISGFCVDGVCCESACASGCETCAAVQAQGSCVTRLAGSPPRLPSDCPVSAPAACGFDGFCDGARGCQRYLGTVCQAGSCNGDTVVGSYVCDGQGACKPGPTLTLCFPFACDPGTGSCFSSCTSSSQCDTQHTCDISTGSCGKGPIGGTCQEDADCLSDHCADHVCCNIACGGACAACNLSGRVGTCWPIDVGMPDPRGVCKDQGPASCGNDGTCDGIGGCANYANGTQCVAPSCTGDRLNTVATCDGHGTCGPTGVVDCHPFGCVGGACNHTCATSADCDVGTGCVNGTCGPKQLGNLCGANAECASNFCVDGVCCESACSGTCVFCALPSSPGRCVPIAVGSIDPRGVCLDGGASSCGTNGRCNGAGSCAIYPPGTTCAAETCLNRLYTGPSTCNATGHCTAPDARPCAPYLCAGSQCFTGCTTNDQCNSPNACVSGSCGLKGAGAACSSSTECQAGLSCAQGFCCNSPCTGACQSCALPGSQGVCTDVPAGTVDPAAQCKDQGATSCGTDGRCDGNGGCRRYPQGTVCGAPTCPAGTSQFTPASICDGNGACVGSTPIACFPYSCGASACQGACSADIDCVMPAACTNGSCGLKGNGQTCASAADCASGVCAQSVCCATDCSGSCQSCALPTTLGVCTNVPPGSTDPQGRCHDQGTTSCGTDGLCDGAGACRKYASGAPCAPSACPSGSSTLTLERTCDGQGTCQPAATISCQPYLCTGGSACKAACISDGDCLSPDICDPMTGRCGNKSRLGQGCSGSTDCLTGNFCVDGVCCATSACNTACQACNVAGSAGVCTAIPDYACALPNGSACVLQQDCASGFCVACGGAGSSGVCMAPSDSPCVPPS